MDRCAYLIAAILVGLVLPPAACRGLPRNAGHHPLLSGGPRREGLIWSADVATGLANGTSGSNTVADIDDGCAIVSALNSGIEIDLVVPVTGNAHVSAEFPLTRWILHGLKGRNDLEIRPGAPYPIVPFLESPAAFINGSAVPQPELVEACVNMGVMAMQKRLALGGKRTILATGPLTDIACLVSNFPEDARNIERVVVLGGRHSTDPLVFEGAQGLTDFNIRMDPVAVHLLLGSGTPLEFIPFNLSSSAVYSPDQFGEGLSASQKESQTFQFFQAAVDARALWYEKVGFGNVLVPWDTWPLLHVMRPGALRCKPMLAKLQPCAYAPWDDSYNASTGMPYNDGGQEQMCGGHGAGVSGGSLLEETAQLQFFPLPGSAMPASASASAAAAVVTVCDEVSGAQSNALMDDLVLRRVF